VPLSLRCGRFRRTPYEAIIPAKWEGLRGMGPFALLGFELVFEALLITHKEQAYV
jgi:hypothetical protein